MSTVRWIAASLCLLTAVCRADDPAPPYGAPAQVCLVMAAPDTTATIRVRRLQVVFPGVVDPTGAGRIAHEWGAPQEFTLGKDATAYDSAGRRVDSAKAMAALKQEICVTCFVEYGSTPLQPHSTNLAQLRDDVFVLALAVPPEPPAIAAP